MKKFKIPETVVEIFQGLAILFIMFVCAVGGAFIKALDG